jgi:tRNA(Ile)-lysidine synthase
MEPLDPVPQPLEWTKPLGRAADLELGPGVGRLAFVPDEHGPFTARQIAGGLSVRFRVGGETLRTRSAGPTRRVKELLRSAAVPPWLRGRIPLIYSGGQLLSVGGRWNLAPRPPSGGRKPRRYRIEWRTSARWFD